MYFGTNLIACRCHTSLARRATAIARLPSTFLSLARQWVDIGFAITIATAQPVSLPCRHSRRRLYSRRAQPRWGACAGVLSCAGEPAPASSAASVSQRLLAIAAACSQSPLLAIAATQPSPQLKLTCPLPQGSFSLSLSLSLSPSPPLCRYAGYLPTAASPSLATIKASSSRGGGIT